MKENLLQLWLFSLLFFLTTSLACTRAAVDESKTANIRISIPSAASFSSAHKSDFSAASVTMNYSLFCFVANIKGGGVSSIPAHTCDIDKGLVLGSAPPGGVLAIDLNPGSGYTFEIYGLLRSSVSDSCPAVNATNWNWPLDKIYFLGRAVGVEVVAPTTDVNINLTLPSVSNNLAVNNGMPSTCVDLLLPANGLKTMRTALGVKQLTGSSYKAYARVDIKNEIKNLSGANFKLKKWRIR